MQTMQPFYLLLRYMSLERDLPSDDPSRDPSKLVDPREDIVNAMRRLDNAQRLELVQFLDKILASGADDKTMARVFDDGHHYIVWRNPQAPRQLLTLIRDIAQAQS